VIPRTRASIGSYLGETASRVSKLIDFARGRACVLFFDEFDTLSKERGDRHETGEIKRVVSSLLLQFDQLPSYVVTDRGDKTTRSYWIGQHGGDFR